MRPNVTCQLNVTVDIGGIITSIVSGIGSIFITEHTFKNGEDIQ
jgi:hypothetical protein